MTTPVVPGPGQYWPPTPSPATAPPPPPRRTPALWWILGAVGLVVVVAVGAVVLLASSLDRPAAQTPQVQQQTAANQLSTATTGPAPAAVDTPAPVVTPKASDFQLTAKITKKECFGSAGCNIEFWVKMAYREDAPDLDPADTWIVTYEVSGVEDGPQINSIEVTGDTYSHDETEIASTTSSSKKLTVKVTGVEKQGI